MRPDVVEQRALFLQVVDQLLVLLDEALVLQHRVVGVQFVESFFELHAGALAYKCTA